MAQQGNLIQSHGAWFVRYREKMNGKWSLVARRLASVTEYPKKREVMSLKTEFMRKVNATAKTLGAGVSLVEFVEQTFLPELARRGLSPSTVNNYKNIWAKHLKVRAAGFRVRDFRTCDGESLMQAMGRQYGNDLAHGTYCRIKSMVSAIFTAAKRSGVYDGVNPMTGVSIPKGRRHGRKTHAYSLIEISHHIALFHVVSIAIKQEDGSMFRPEVSPAAVRAVIGVAAFAGLRQGEIRGLWRADDEGHVLSIRRSIWRTVVKGTKTGEDEDEPGIVPIIQPLRVLLDASKSESNRKTPWMFPNTVGGALDLHNLAERVIRPVLEEAGLSWYGWHAYRRGLATNLKSLGVDDLVIQAILRHTDVATTRRSYIKTARPDVVAAMHQLEVACVADVQHVGASRLLN